MVFETLPAKLGYLKDSNAAAHSVDSDIFYVANHVQLLAPSTRGVTKDRGQKAHGDLDCLGKKRCTSTSPLIAKIERCENCRSTNLTSKFCADTHKCP